MPNIFPRQYFHFYNIVSPKGESTNDPITVSADEVCESQTETLSIETTKQTDQTEYLSSRAKTLFEDIDQYYKANPIDTTVCSCVYHPHPDVAVELSLSICILHVETDGQ